MIYFIAGFFAGELSCIVIPFVVFAVRHFVDSDKMVKTEVSAESEEEMNRIKKENESARAFHDMMQYDAAAAYRMTGDDIEG